MQPGLAGIVGRVLGFKWEVQSNPTEKNTPPSTLFQCDVVLQVATVRGY